MSDNTITVQLTLDSDLQTAFAKQAKVVDGETKKLESTFGGLGGTIKKLGLAIASAFTVGKIIEFGKASVKAYDESILAATKLKTALGYTSEALLEQAEAFQKTTRFEDDSITSAQALLAIYGLSEAQIKKLTPAILDYASATGSDLESAMDKVGRTITTSTSAFAREGIVVSDSTSKSARLEEVLGQLETRFKGQAVAAGEVGAGGIIKLSNSFGNLMENIGEAITKSEAYESALKSLSKVVGSFIEKSKVKPEDTGLENALQSYRYDAKKLEEEIVRANERLKTFAKTSEADFDKQFGKGNRKYNMDLLNDLIEQKNKELKGIQGSIDILNKRMGNPPEFAPPPPPHPNPDKITGAEKEKPEYMVDGIPYSEWLKARQQHFAIISASNQQLAKIKQDQIDLGAEATDSEIEQNERVRQSNERVRQSIENKRLAEEAYINAVMYGTANMIGAFAGLNAALKGDAEATKMLMRSETIMSTAAGIMKAYAQGGVLGFVTGTAIGVEGATQLARIDAQKFALGGDFVTSGPQAIVVGDNPGGRERVQVTPISSTNYNGPQSGGMSIDMSVHIAGSADESTVKAINVSREKHLKRLKRDLQELVYARQIPSFA